MAQTEAKDTGLSVKFVTEMIANKRDVAEKLKKPGGGDVFLFKDGKG